MNLKEIEARHERETIESPFGVAVMNAHADRAALLAKVKRLNAFVAKVRASKSGWHDTYSTEEVDQALAELDE